MKTSRVVHLKKGSRTGLEQYFQGGDWKDILEVSHPPYTSIILASATSTPRSLIRLDPTVIPICPVPLTPPKQQRKILGQFLMEPSNASFSAPLKSQLFSKRSTTIEPDRMPSSVAENVELHCLLGASLYEKEEPRFYPGSFLIRLMKARPNWAVGLMSVDFREMPMLQPQRSSERSVTIS